MNVLVYAVDVSEPERMAQASALLRRLAGTEQALISAQVLAQFANATLRRLRTPLSSDEVYQQVEHYERVFPPVALTAAIVLEAVRGVRDYQLAYYDAQIWAAARLGRVPYVLSEDFNSGATLEGVTFLNPFADDFDLASL